MKKMYGLAFAIIITMLAVFSAESASAGRAALTWNANSESDLAGYKIYWGSSARTGTEAPGGYANGPINVGNVTTYTVDNIPDTGTSYFSITASDTSNNESDMSNEVRKTPGDMNTNGTVDMSDFNILAINFNQTVANCAQSGNYNQADVNLDCTVNMSDFNALAINFGHSIN